MYTSVVSICMYVCIYIYIYTHIIEVKDSSGSHVKVVSDKYIQDSGFALMLLLSSSSLSLFACPAALGRLLRWMCIGVHVTMTKVKVSSPQRRDISEDRHAMNSLAICYPYLK